MTEQRPRRADELFGEIVALPPGERHEALDRLCAGDGDLRAEVESLLLHDASGQGFLDRPALGTGFALPVPGPEDDALVGTTIGAYEITRFIAGGGMGLVYEASRQDGAFRQRVAVKLVRSGVDNREMRRRFHTERQTLAQLNHPNIATLMDGGTHVDGRPYLVMEFVDGVPITRYCDEQRLGLSARIRLFVKVCAAVHYAHRNLIIHRDLKPSNILVTPGGEPKLLDFGIAKLLDAGSPARLETMTAGIRPLTPEYASPEQLLGKPMTTASDIYSLGVILYELLAGRRPFTLATRTFAEAQRIMTEQEITAPSAAITRLPAQSGEPDNPPTSALEVIAAARDTTPRRLRESLRGDLDTIVLMAVRKDPARRYLSAEQLGDDLTRFLDGRPVTARRETVWYLTSKFLRRHKAVVAAAAVAVITLVSGVVAVTLEARATQRALGQALMALQHARAVRTFWEDILASVAPEREGPEVRVVDLLERATAVGNLPTEDPDVEATLHGVMGRAFLTLGKYDKAEAQLRRALELHREAVGHHHFEIVSSLNDLATYHYHMRDLERAESLLREALDLAERLTGPTRDLDIATTLNNLGAVRRAAGDLDEAESFHARALALRRQIHGGDEHADVAESLNNLGYLHFARGEVEAALDETARALAIRRATLGDTHPLTMQSLHNNGFLLLQSGRIDDAEPLLREAVTLTQQVNGPRHPDTAGTMLTLGVLLRMKGEHAEAEPLLRTAAEVRQATYRAGDERLVMALVQWAGALQGMGRFDDAAAALDQAEGALGAEPAERLVRFVQRARDELAQARAATIPRDLNGVP